MWGSACFIVCVALLVVGFFRYQGGPGYPLDDTWIHLAFARNLAAGDGFAVNPGVPTPGATSPLWVLLLSLGFLCGAGAEPWPWILAGVILAVCGLCAAGLCRDLQTNRRESRYVLIGSCCCGLATVVLAPLVWSAAGAMEVPLLGMLLLADIWIFQRARRGNWKHALGWGICAGLAANARPEGLLLIPILTGLALLPSPRKNLGRAGLGLLSALLLTVPYGVFCLSTSGRWFPNTYYAKTGDTALHLPDLSYIGELLREIVWPMAPEALLLLPLALLGLFFWYKDRNAVVPAAAAIFVFALPLAYACMHRTVLFADVAGNFGRYLYPIFPVALAVGYAGLLRIAGHYSGRLLPIASVVLGVLLLLTSVRRTISQADFYATNVRDINRMQVHIALRLKEELPPGALVAANDVGALAYLTDLRVLDLIGIISIDVLDLMRPIDGNQPKTRFELARYLADQRPAAIVLFPRWYPKIYQWLQPGLELIEDVRVNDDITSGADQLTAFRIDWSRVPDPTKMTRRRTPP